jgi:2-iminobutanoate/2-iminopropanoate deaminase
MTRPNRIGSGVAVGSRKPLIATAMRWGDLLFLSGIAAVDPQSLEPLYPDFEGQAQYVIERANSVLQEAGTRVDHVLRVEAFLADAGDFPAWNRLFGEWFAAGAPARTTVVVAFAAPGVLFEIELTAGIPA